MATAHFSPEYVTQAGFFVLLILVCGLGLFSLNRFLKNRTTSSDVSQEESLSKIPFHNIRHFSLNDFFHTVLVSFFIIITVLLFLAAAAYAVISVQGFMGIFIALFILMAGYWYAWKKGAIDPD